MRDVRCPVVIGREGEIEDLLLLLDGAGGGGGSGVLLLGEAGVGKSRLAELATAAARSRGMLVLRGRAASSPAPAPYRPFAEAFLSTLRTSRAYSVAELPGFRAALAALVPGWAGEVSRPAEPSLILLGEAVLALLRSLGDQQGVFVLLEDLHWADPGSLEVLDYLLDKLDGTGAVVVATIRTGEGSVAEAQARSLQAQRRAAVVELARLPPVEVARMISAVLGADDLPAHLVDVVQAASDGLPFLVEEVLASLVNTEVLVRDQGRWEVRGTLRAAVPPSFAATVERRIESLSPSAASLVQTAAVLGDRFDWSLLGAVSGFGEEDVIAALRMAASQQIVEEDPSGSGFRFRHALTRAAVVDTLLLPERVAIARTALAVLSTDEAADAGRLELAAELADTAGDHGRAMDLLVASAAAALRQGALSSASASAERVLNEGPQPEVVRRALEVLLEASVLAGDAPRASHVGGTLLARLDALGASPQGRADVHLRLAESSVAATDWQSAKEHLDVAAELDPAGDDRRAVRRRLLEARTALGQHRAADAADHVRAALETTERLGFDDLLCESLELMGRVERALNLPGAERWFTRALAAAEGTGSNLSQVRVLLELGILDMFGLRSAERLVAAEKVAVEIGAPVLAAQASLHLAILLSFRFQIDEARAAAERAYESGARYRLGLLVPAAAIVLGATDAYLGRRADAIGWFERGRAQMDLDIEVVGRQYLALAALAVEDRAAALQELHRAEALLPEGSPITRSPFRPVLALLLALEGESPAALLGGFEGSGHVLLNGLADLVRAVVAGRAGDHKMAERLFSQADLSLLPAPWFRMVGRRLVAEAAIADGWGAPAGWLEEAHAFFSDAGLEPLARGGRSLSRRAGTTLSSRQSGLHPELAGVGVTQREAEVLALVADGLANKDIAERLYLSTRTVEKHVERLLLKTGMINRTQLAALASRLGPRT